MDDRSGGGIAVEISGPQPHVQVEHEDLARLVRNVLTGEGVRQAEISLALLDDVAIRRVNRQYLDHDWPTDVISFRLSEPGAELLSAELVVSGQMAAATAAEAGTDPRDELVLYVVHGLLHLCGYDDGSAVERAEMRQREAEVLRREGRVDTFERVGAAPRENSTWPR
jgi:probable rRNA maturation factor